MRRIKRPRTGTVSALEIGSSTVSWGNLGYGKGIKKDENMAEHMMWILDASQETFEPGFVHEEGRERQMQIGVNLNGAEIPQTPNIRIDMRLTCTISVNDKPSFIAEISAASIVGKEQMGSQNGEIHEELYQFVKSFLESMLRAAHYNPPLPEKLSDIKQQ
jgi:hypothetical protein